MKILFVLTYYRPHWTGLSQYAARLAEGLAKRGHQVEVLCSQHDKKLSSYEEINKVKVFRVPFLFKFLRSVIMPKFPLELWKRARENEAVIVYLPLQEVLLIAIICKILGRKLFLVHNGDLVLPKDCGFFCRLVEKIYYWTTGLAIGWSEKIIVQTKDYADLSPLLNKFKEKWAIILPLYETMKVANKDIVEFKKKYSLPNKKLIGFSGRFVEEKGVDYLLKTIPLVVKRYPGVHFVFAGDYKIQYEKFWERIKNLVEENKKNLTLLGLIKDQKKVFTFYKSLDVYVQPSRTDCFPSSLVEAMLCGVPAVCTNIPGTRWSVLKTGMGEVVEPKNPEALAEGILKVLSNIEIYTKNSKNVRKIFDYQKTLDQYERLLSQS